MDNIINIEKEIQLLKLKADNTNKKRKIARLKTEIKKLSLNQHSQIIAYLIESNTDFNRISHENSELLKNDNIVFGVSKKAGSMIKLYDATFKGTIHSNGYLYFKPFLTSTSFNLFSGLSFPLGYKGTINSQGIGNIRPQKYASSMGGTYIPKKFKGSIDLKGNITLSPRDMYFTTSSGVTVERIVGDPFSKDENKRSLFLKNRLHLLEMVDKLKESICNY